MSLRIIAGEFGGRKLTAPADGTRPMMDRVKESLFSSLGARVQGNVLDLYAGSGALGLESLSRGAELATFVERDTTVCESIEQNAATLGVLDRVTIEQMAVSRFVTREPAEQFNLVFVAPPYAYEEIDTDLVALGPWVAPEATVVVERASEDGLPELPPYLVLVKEKVFGGTMLGVYEVV